MQSRIKTSLATAVCIAAIACSAPAFAQGQPPSETVVNARLQYMQSQRNEMADRNVILAGQLAELEQKLAAANAELEKLKTPADKKK